MTGSRSALITAEAENGSGSTDQVTVRGDWGAGEHTLTVDFLNDELGDGGDRNLFVERSPTTARLGELDLYAGGAKDLVFG